MTLVGLLLWVLGMLADGRLERRRSALDLPLVLLIALVIVQLVLSNRPLANWALAPPPSSLDSPATLPSTFLTLGTVAPARTASSLFVLLTYAGAYLLTVNVIRTRQQLHRMIAILVSFGGVLAFASLLDYLGGEAWLLRWRDRPLAGRLAGTYGNPDHFAAWLSMIISLGVGLLLARPWGGKDRRLPLLSREGREEIVRQYLPFVGLVVMVLALVFTLSRGGVLSLLLTLLILIVLLGYFGWVRWSLTVVGALLVVVVGYAAWIGLDPLLARVKHPDYTQRWLLLLTTLPMLQSFPLLGIGLGAFGNVYGRYQPALLEPGKIDVGYAHNDLLQLVVELGAVGTALLLFMVWRLSKDLVGAHLLGWASCPVGGGEHEGAIRHDPFSIGVAVGAVGAATALVIHGVFDFGGHIPANGTLAATCLGIATVALHTRFGARGARLLTAVRIYSMPTRRARLLTGAAVIVVSVSFVPWILRPPMVATLVDQAARDTDRATALGRLDWAVTLDPRGEPARAARGQRELEAALDVWNVGLTVEGRLLPSWEERRAAALPLLSHAIEDLQTAISGTPLDPFLHETLARAYWTAALLDPAQASGHLSAALASFSRGAESVPQSPLPYRSLAVFAVQQGDGMRPIGLRAARNAVQRDPSLLPELVYRFLPLGLSTTEWITMVPASVADLLELGVLLEKRGLLSTAADVYHHASDVGPATDTAVARWMLGRLLLRQGRSREALAEVDRALAQDAANPELHIHRARALAALGEATAVDAYRLAVLNAEVRARQPAEDRQAFGRVTPRVRAVISDAMGPEQRSAPDRYRRALAQYLNDTKRWEEALKQWDIVLAEAPTDAAAHFARGVALEGLGGHDQAVDAFREAVALDGNNVGFRLRFARRLWETEQYYQAINEWRAVVGLAPGNVDARLSLARAYVKVGSLSEAAREYQQLLRIVPDPVEVQRELAGLGHGAPKPMGARRPRK